MNCPCCGRTLLSTDRLCPSCGQNNDNYVEPVETNVVEKQIIQQPINRVPINNQNYSNQNQYYSQNNYQQQQYIYQNQVSRKCASSSAIKVFMVLGCILSAWLWIIPLCWTIPMTIHSFGCLDRGEKMTTAFKVCTLLFCSLIAGIIMLCDNDA